MLKNPSNENAVFVARPDGGFSRFNALNGRPMPAAHSSEPVLYDAGGGKIGFGRFSPTMAQDQMPANLSSMPPIDPSKAQAIGARRQSQDQSEPQALSKEHAAALHDLAVKANVPESDYQAFSRVLALLSGGGEAGGAADRGGGSGKITRDQAARAWQIAKDGGLSPQDLSEFTKLLANMIGPDLEEPNDEGALDQPPAFPGRPTPGGKLVGDAARSFDAEFPNVRRLALSDDHYGEQAPPSRKALKQSALALDAATRTGGGDDYLGGDKQLDADIRRILK
jgi:hypothetical protein